MAAQAPSAPKPRQLVHLRSSHQQHPLQWRWSSANAILDASPPILTSQLKSGQSPQNFRNSLAITNSDYYNARRPQLLQVLTGLHHTPSAPALDTISENEPIHSFRSQEVPLSADAIPEQSETLLFRYTPTPEPARQTIPMSLSRTSTPGPPRSRSTTPQSLAPVPQPTLATPQAGSIPFSELIRDQFVPLYYQPQSGRVYRLESGYYVPLSQQQLRTLVNGVTVLEQPSLIADRRTVNEEAPDYTRFSQTLMLLLFLCCDFPVLLLCSLPTLFCVYKVKKANEDGRYRDAKTASGYALLFNTLAIAFHVVLVILLVIATMLVLHFVFDIFS